MQGLKLYGLLAVHLCVLVQNADAAAARVDPLVETNVGLISGLQSPDGTYSMFMGIPYAIVDESNPFGPSVPHPAFSQVFEAYDDSAICPQIEEFNNTIVGSLDCLHLNIYVPNSASSRNRLPVLVWIYGGGFSIGFSGRYLYGPSYIVRHDVILVTLNYRLGPYGFMCLDTPEVPGNQGLKDQYLALKWIKNHIAAFGGDTDKITIFGESAGGASVDLHLHYTKENLFNGAILQSGTAMANWVVEESDWTIPLKLADLLGLSTENLEEALSFLTTVDPSLVIAVSSNLDITYRPCVEKAFDGVESFMTEHPINSEVPRVKDVPILIGHNNDEEIYRDQLPASDLIHEYLARYFNFEESQLAEMETLVKHFYIGDEIINEQSKGSIINFSSDFQFNHPTQRSITKYLENGAKAVYQYMFSYTGERNFKKQMLNMTYGGAAHADEISYLFDVSYMKEPSPDDQSIIDRITNLWTNFVKYGNPTPEATDQMPFSWTPVSEESQFYMNLDLDMYLDRRPFHDRMAFWDLFYKLNKQSQKGFKVD